MNVFSQCLEEKTNKCLVLLYIFLQKLRHHFFLYVFRNKTFGNPVIKRKSAATINQYNNICENKIRMRLFLTNFEYVTKLLDSGQLTFFCELVDWADLTADKERFNCQANAHLSTPPNFSELQLLVSNSKTSELFSNFKYWT